MAIFNDNDDQERDYFDEIPEEEPVEREPEYPEDDPRYWDKDDDRWEHLRPRKSIRWYLILGAAAVLVALLVAGYFRYLNPNVTEAVQYGYIDHIEKRGMIFKTEEGVLLPYKSINDTITPYTRDFVFSANDEVAAMLRYYEKNHKPVRVTYDVYYATVPWRGASKIVITGVDSVADPSKLLPPGWEQFNQPAADKK